jgi:hypothetical protein
VATSFYCLRQHVLLQYTMYCTALLGLLQACHAPIDLSSTAHALSLSVKCSFGMSGSGPLAGGSLSHLCQRPTFPLPLHALALTDKPDHSRRGHPKLSERVCQLPRGLARCAHCGALCAGSLCTTHPPPVPFMCIAATIMASKPGPRRAARPQALSSALSQYCLSVPHAEVRTTRPPRQHEHHGVLVRSGCPQRRPTAKLT